MAKFSTGLRTQMLSGGSLKAALDGGLILIYAGAVPPVDADAPIVLANTPLLCTISLTGGGGGIAFDTAAAAAVLSKAPAQAWSGTNSGTGGATFFRHVAAGDIGAQSATAVRIQGSVASAGADLNLSNVNLTAGAVQTVDYYSIALPTL
jgi:hypothetical protein